MTIPRKRRILGAILVFLAVGAISTCFYYFRPYNLAMVKKQAQISVKQAEESAINHIGISDLIFHKTKLETDTKYPNPYYALEAHKKGIEYELKVDAVTGKVLSYETDHETVGQSRGKPAPKTVKVSKKEEDIKKIANQAIGRGDLNYASLHLITDDGRHFYEVKAVSGDKVYELDIDAATGAVLSLKQEPILQPVKEVLTAPQLSEEQLKAIVEKTTGVKPLTYTAIKLSQEADDYQGVLVYEVTAYGNGKKYHCDIDASTGAVLHYSVDSQ